eukprot:jgi/Mesvir1/16453/Mv12093-RA.1
MAMLHSLSAAKVPHMLQAASGSLLFSGKQALPQLPSRAAAGPRGPQHGNLAGGRKAVVMTATAPWPLVPQTPFRFPFPSPKPQPRREKEPWEFDPLDLGPSVSGPNGEELIQTVFHMAQGGGTRRPDESMNPFQTFFSGNLPTRLIVLLALLVLSRVGVYIPLPGVDRAAFAANVVKEGGLLGYVDTLAGGSISRVGLFSLGIVPYINSSIVTQLLASAIPEWKKLQREEGEAGRRKFEQYTRIGALLFAIAGGIGQSIFLRPYVLDYDIAWVASSTLSLTAGSMLLMYIAELITDLKIGNGTSLLIFVNIVSSLPSGVGRTISDAMAKEGGNPPLLLAAFFGAFLAITSGVVYVQLAERKIPVNYASRYSANAGGLQRSSYLPFKVNSAGVMPIIFASSVITVPAVLSRYDAFSFLQGAANALYSGGALYVPINVALIAFFNYFYTFLQLDPNDVSEQLKKSGASIQSIRPGNATANYLTKVLSRISFLGSIFLGILAATPSLVEGTTGLNTFRGFAGTSLLILVGVATDTATKVKSEMVMQQYDTLQEQGRSSRM